jgi:hypothetical protein
MAAFLPLALVVLIVVALGYLARKGRKAREMEQRARVTTAIGTTPAETFVSVDPNATVRCPFCSEPILASAKKCKHCGEFLDRKTEDVGYLPPEIAEKLSPMVQAEAKKLSTEKMAYFLEELQRRSKVTGIAYICWVVGLHYAYMERWSKLIIFWLTAGGFLVWWIADAFRMPSLIRDCNKDVATKVFRELRIMGI